MKRSEFKQLIKEEVQLFVEELMHNISEKLQALHKSITETARCDEVHTDRRGRVRHYHSLPLETVSKLTEIPINQLMLYFRNGQYNLYENSPVELRQQIVYFYKG